MGERPRPSTQKEKTSVTRHTGRIGGQAVALADAIAESERFATGEYQLALFKGTRVLP